MPVVNSSVIARIEYDDEACELDIVFTSGKAYRYFDVPPEVYDAFLEAPSKGEFFNTMIRDGYRYNDVVAPPRR